MRRSRLPATAARRAAPLGVAALVGVAGCGSTATGAPQGSASAAASTSPAAATTTAAGLTFGGEVAGAFVPSSAGVRCGVQNGFTAGLTGTVDGRAARIEVAWPSYRSAAALDVAAGQPAPATVVVLVGTGDYTSSGRRLWLRVDAAGGSVAIDVDLRHATTYDDSGTTVETLSGRVACG